MHSCTDHIALVMFNSEKAESRNLSIYLVTFLCMYVCIIYLFVYLFGF